MLFNLNANCNFEAEDLDDAFIKLALHFLKITYSEDSKLFDANSRITINPKKEY